MSELERLHSALSHPLPIGRMSIFSVHRTGEGVLK
jgi:hypothetical protein